MHLGLGAKIHVHIATDGSARVFVLRAIAIVGVVVLDEAFVSHQIQIGEVAEVLAAALELKVELVGVADVAERLVGPVDVGIVQRVAIVLVALQHGITIAAGSTFVTHGLVDRHAVSVGIDERRFVNKEVEAVVVGERDALAVVLTVLGGDKDGSVGTLVTIESGGGSILQDGDTLHVF